MRERLTAGEWAFTGLLLIFVIVWLAVILRFLAWTAREIEGVL